VSRAAVLMRADARRLLRDPMFALLSALPLLVAIALRVAGVDGMARLPFPLEPAAIAMITTAGLLLLTPMMFGFVIGLMLLDERDDGVLTAIAMTPVGKSGFLARRMTTPVLWSGVATVLVVLLAGMTRFPPERLAVLVLLAGLQAPLLALFLGAFAPDKVRGMALGKVGTALIGIGALGVLAPAPWQWLAAVSPHYWMVRLAIADGATTAAAYGALVAAAVTVHLGALWLLARAFRARVG
jgi:fluoroquinolone transport system permease protein